MIGKQPMYIRVFGALYYVPSDSVYVFYWVDISVSISLKFQLVNIQ